MSETIDFVITWVDENDPKWRNERDYYAGISTKRADKTNVRYRDWDNLRYWFRGVEKFAPWVNKIFFVTYGHVPKWLNMNNPKLVIVKHEEFIPREYLPTFNSNVIEFYFHRIKGLSENFVYFNDDQFIIDKIAPERFFENGLPCDVGGLSYPNCFGIFGCSVLLAITQINIYFKPKDVILKNVLKWLSPVYLPSSFKVIFMNLFMFRIPHFISFRDHHLPQGYSKSIYNDVWKHCQSEIQSTSCSRFRSYGDIAHWLIRYWQLASGSFTPYNVYKDGKIYHVNDENITDVESIIRQQKVKLICVNDSIGLTNFIEAKDIILNAFESILPEVCSFEQ